MSERASRFACRYCKSTDAFCDTGEEASGCPLQDLGEAIKDVKALVISAADQAGAMTDAELADRLLTGRWTTVEVHEAGRRLARRGG